MENIICRMTEKEKAKAYDEALKRARKLKEDPKCVFYEYSPKEGDTICDYIFPELKESEDERIGKELIEFVKSRGGFKQEYITWLEKQAKQKSIWNEEDEHRIKLLEALCEDKLFESVPNSTMYGEMRKTIDWLNFLRPQPKQEWSDEDDRIYYSLLADIRTRQDGGTSTLESYYNEQIEWIKSLKQRIIG